MIRQANLLHLFRWNPIQFASFQLKLCVACEIRCMLEATQTIRSMASDLPYTFWLVPMEMAILWMGHNADVMCQNCCIAVTMHPIQPDSQYTMARTERGKRHAVERHTTENHFVLCCYASSSCEMSGEWPNDNNSAKAACVQYQCRLLSIRSSSKWKYPIHRRWLWMSLLHVHLTLWPIAPWCSPCIRRICVDSMQNHSKLMAQNRPVPLLWQQFDPNYIWWFRFYSCPSGCSPQIESNGDYVYDFDTPNGRGKCAPARTLIKIDKQLIDIVVFAVGAAMPFEFGGNTHGTMAAHEGGRIKRARTGCNYISICA